MARARRTTSPPPPSRGRAITLRLDDETYRRLGVLAGAENRDPVNYVETLVLRDIAARDEAARVITMLVPEDARGAVPGALLRSEGESDARHAERAALFNRLFDLPDTAG